MSFIMRQVAHCDVCGHEWLTAKVPSHCAKCKSRKWNQRVDSMREAQAIAKSRIAAGEDIAAVVDQFFEAFDRFHCQI